LVNSNFELYDVNDKMKPINKQLDFKFKTTKEYVIDDYSCSKPLTDCVITGNHTEQREVWENISFLNWKDAETYTIGIFTNVGFDETVEWIPTLYGTKINEWAIFTSGAVETTDGDYT